tara:strand:+ start:498 stop:746 length:249 start_codon:yes stop_codon:yes gene_type:complete
MRHFDKRKIFWHSRRGMRELDLLFVPFITEGFDSLSESEKKLYEELLEEEDQDLYSWLLGSCKPDRIEYELLISKILEHRKN